MTRASSGVGLSRSRMVCWLWGNSRVGGCRCDPDNPLWKWSQSYPCVLRLIHVVWHSVLGTWMECSHFPDEGRSRQGEYTGGWVVQCGQRRQLWPWALGTTFLAAPLCWMPASQVARLQSFLGIGGCCEQEEWGCHTFGVITACRACRLLSKHC